MRDFNSLASRKTNLRIEATSAYKLCDFRPAFGVIFEDYLEKYDFWGHADLDLVFGNIRGFITDEVLSRYDIISTRKRYLAGHLTLFRNEVNINRLYREASDYKHVFESKKYYNFDECNYLHTQLVRGEEVEETRLASNNMTYIVKKLAKQGVIRLHLTDLAKEIVSPDKDFRLHFDNGRLIDTSDNNELMYIHLLKLKNRYAIQVPAFESEPNSFYITNYEIFYESEMGLARKAMISSKRWIYLEIDRFCLKVGQLLRKRYPKLYHLLRRHNQSY